MSIFDENWRPPLRTILSSEEKKAGWREKVGRCSWTTTQVDSHGVPIGSERCTEHGVWWVPTTPLAYCDEHCNPKLKRRITKIWALLRYDHILFQLGLGKLGK